MSLDIYVMPFKKFKCLDYESPLQQAIGTENATLKWSGTIAEPIPHDTISHAVARTEAKETLDQLLHAVRHANPGSQITWPDQGDVYFAEQATVLEAAQTYARWLTYQEEFPTFEVEDDEFESHCVWDLTSKKLLYPQLSLHDCFSGYFFPCDFPNMISFESYQNPIYTMASCIGSSIRLREELKEIGKTLGMQWKVGEGLVEDKRSFTDRSTMMELVVGALLQLSAAAETSCNKRLPILFD